MEETLALIPAEDKESIRSGASRQAKGAIQLDITLTLESTPNARSTNASENRGMAKLLEHRKLPLGDLLIEVL